MTYKTLSGKEPADEILKQAKEDIAKLHFKPMLGIVVVGNYKPTEIYVNRKKTAASEVGMDAEINKLPENVEESELIALIERLNKDQKINGFIVQTPLPKHINTQRVFEHISPDKDVDGFHPRNMGKVLLNIFDDSMFSPATPTGILKLLQHYDIPIAGSNAVVVGRSNVVGKPAAVMLLHHDATVTICHSHTKDLANHTKNADILVVAAGNPKLITENMVKEGAYVVDVGTTRIRGSDGKDRVVGDVDFENVIKKANCSPVPGGVGPLTVAMLISNTVKAAKRRK